MCSTTTGHCRTETTGLPPYLGTNSGTLSALVLKIDMTSVIGRSHFLENSVRSCNRFTTTVHSGQEMNVNKTIIILALIVLLDKY